MAESGNPNPKAGKLSRVGRRTARRRRNFPESREPEVEEEDRGEKQSFGEKFVMEKVQEFFLECGGGERGFITREDMQKLQQKFPFSSEELEMVFDNLDVDTKGILTPEQLTEGLSQFLSDQGEDRNVSCLKVAAEPQYTHSDSHSLQDQVDVEDEEKHQFAALMEKLGAAVIFEDKSEIWKLWIQLRRNEPNLLGHLEDFLSKMTGQIQDTLHEKEDLERTLKKKMVEHNADMQRLYEEMELQINNEKERIEGEIVVRFQAQSQDLQKELDSKQDEVQHLVQMQAQLQAELVSLRCKQDETSAGNQELKMSSQEMAWQVEGVQQELQEARDRLVILQEEAAHREEREGEWRQSLGLEGPRSEEAVQQFQAELESLRSKRDETSTENQELHLTNQELEARLEGIQQELQVAQDRLEILQEEAAHGEEREGELDASPGQCSKEAFQQLQAELVSLHSKQDETSTENQELHLTNQELGARLEGIEQELQEARDRLVTFQEEAAHRVERGGELDPTPGSAGPCSEEAFQQLQAELVSLHSKQDETSTENQQLHLTNQELGARLEEARDRLVILQEEAAHREERGGELDPSSGSVGSGSEETIQKLQAELVSLRSKQDETSTENQQLELTNQEMKTQLEGIQQELQEARDQLVILQEEKEKGEDQQSGIGRADSDEVALQLQAELESLRSKQDETSTENQELHLTNQELEARLEGIQQELEEARDRLMIPQEDAARQEEGDGELDWTPSIEGWCSEEATQQLQAELVSLRSKQDETSTENQQLELTNQEMKTQLEGIQQELQEARDQLVILQEEKEKGDDQQSGIGRADSDEVALQLQAELVSLRSKQDETSTENQQLELTNQEMKTQLEGIQQELQEARDQLVILQEEKEKGDDQQSGIGRADSDEVALQLQAELVSLRSKQDETSTENQQLELTNQEMKTQLEGIQQELQEARDQLVILQEEKEKGEDQQSGIGRADSDEVALQLQAELESLRSKQDETSTENQELHLTNQELEARLEGIQQELQEARDRLVIPQEDAARQEEGDGLKRTRSIRRRGAPNMSTAKPDALGDDPHLRVEGHEVTLGTGRDADHEETAAASGGEGAAERIKELQAELVSLRNKQDETSTENQQLHLTNQELEARLEGIQQELQEGRDRLVILQEARDGALDRAAGSGGQLSEEGVLQLQAELESLRNKQGETSTENQELQLTNQELQLTNQELEARLVGIQQELQEAGDRLVILQEEAAHREEREGALEQPPGSEGELCHEDILQLQAELESLHSKQDETSTENQQLHLTNQELEARLEGIQQELQEARDRLVILQEEAAHRDEGEGLQRTRSIRRRVARDTSGKPDAPGEDPHLRVEGQEVTLRTDGDRDREETAAASAGDGATETTKELQVELVSLRSKLDETSTENQEIKLTNQELKAQLEGIQQELQEARDRLVILQEEAAHREEREGLQRTCSIRRRGPRDPSNKPGTLGDEGQEVALGEGGDGAHEETAAVSSSDSTAETVKELQAELESLRSKQDETSTENQAFTLINQELEARLVGIQQELQEARDQLVILQEEAAHRDKGEGLQRTYTIRRRVTRDTSRKPGTPGDDPRLKVEGQGVTLGTGDDGDDEETAAASAGDRAEERTNKMAGSKDPDQVYNIMFVGNSNSGKTSFIQHFCDGIDYRVKTLMVEGRHVALQLWDTAGQERFHCVTKQYFRKADGVIVMYDIASSSSFSTVRYWLSCVKEAASDDVCILLLGNKLDDTAHRQVSKAEAELLAQEYNILFYECSAFTGQNIVACIVHLTKTLKQQEERIQGKTVELMKKPAEKKKCCS